MSPSSVQVVVHDDAWLALFEEEARCVKNALGDGCLEVHHFGSTAIQGLVAKPIIDLLPVVHHIDRVDIHNAQMEALGYECLGEKGIPFRRFFKRFEKACAYHVHVYEADSPEVERHLLFRDWMKGHPLDRKAYGDLKATLAGLYADDPMGYCLEKEPFIRQIETKAGWKGLRLVEALLDSEWQSYHRLCKEQLYDPYQRAYDGLLQVPAFAHAYCFVLYLGDQHVGAARLEMPGARHGVIRALVIDPLYQGRGVGAYFLSQLERWMQLSGVELVRLHAPVGVKAFYLGQGYTEASFNEISPPEMIGLTVDLGKVLYHHG
jgi:GrpB-like predicted nucleotidyltransferase (UPF0157 family)/GNAT superfamily N-acetyltransferase